MRKLQKTEKVMRLNFVIVVVALFFVIGINKQKTNSFSIDFIPVENGYQLQRISLNGSLINVAPAGEVEIGETTVVFRLTDKPINVCEENKINESTDRMLIKHSESQKTIESGGQIPAGVVEFLGDYYLVANDEKIADKTKNKVFYPLTSLYPLNALTYEEFLMIIKSNLKK